MIGRVYRPEAMELRDKLPDDGEIGSALRHLLWEVAYNETSTPGTLRLLADLTKEFERERSGS